MSFNSVDWSYSTDTLQVSEGGLSGRTNDEDIDSDAETKTITDIQRPSASAHSSGSGRLITSNRVAPPTGFDRSNNNLGAGLGTFIGPTIADSTNPNLFILTFERDDLLNNTLRSPDGRTVYTISTKGIGQSSRKSPVTALITDFVKIGLTDPVATFSRSKTGSETIAFGQGKPMKRPDWLKASRPFQTGVSTFTHNEVNYRWIKQKEEYKNTTLELHSDSNSGLGGSSLVATYKDSRRDWSIPPPALVIHQARIETHSAALMMLDEIVLSLVLTEAILKAKAKLQFDPQYLAAAPL